MGEIPTASSPSEDERVIVSYASVLITTALCCMGTLALGVSVSVELSASAVIIGSPNVFLEEDSSMVLTSAACDNSPPSRINWTGV